MKLGITWGLFLSACAPSAPFLTILDLLVSDSVSLLWLRLEVSESSSPYMSQYVNQGRPVLNHTRGARAVGRQSLWEQVCTGVRYLWFCYSLDNLEDFSKTFSVCFRKGCCVLCSLLSIWNAEIMRKAESWLPVAQKLGFFLSYVIQSMYFNKQK